MSNYLKSMFENLWQLTTLSVAFAQSFFHEKKKQIWRGLVEKGADVDKVPDLLTVYDGPTDRLTPRPIDSSRRPDREGPRSLIIIRIWKLNSLEIKSSRRLNRRELRRRRWSRFPTHLPHFLKPLFLGECCFIPSKWSCFWLTSYEPLLFLLTTTRCFG